MVAGAGGGGKWGMSANGYGISLGDNEKSLQLRSDNGYTIL